MRLIELHAFQEKTAAKLFGHIRNARKEVPENAQAIVLSSPTGSGKTVTVLSLLESIYAGQDEHPGNPEATFLWFSDSPELNQQSLEKIARFSSLFPSSKLVSIDADFDHETLWPGHIYFLNTQKLGKKSLLVQKGDNRSFTIWETIKNTILSKPKDFFLVIDEAHRGMSKPGAEAQTIVQRFLKGNGVIPAVPLVIGMSATPQRFETLLEQTGRTKRPVTIDISDVKVSGLLKDRIILYYPSEAQPSDFTLLRAAAKELVNMEAQWQAYCDEQREKLVRPVLVVQAEDGRKNELTRTDLTQAIQALEEEIPGLSSEEIAPLLPGRWTDYAG
jgi:type III restriction enzyme